MPLVPVLLSCNANCIISGTILFIRWRQLKQWVKWFFWTCHAVGTSVKIMTLMALSMALVCLLGQDDWNKVQHDFLVMLYQCWHYMTLMASSVPLLHLIVEDDQNEKQHDFFNHLALLTLASPPCDSNGIVNSTIVFIRSRQLKQCVTELFLCNPIDAGVSITWDNSVINGTIPFVGSK